MMQTHGTDSKWVNGDYHQHRQKALDNHVSLDVVGDIETEKYDLDKLPDELGGPMYRRQYIFGPDDGGEVDGGEFDIRDLPGHR